MIDRERLFRYLSIADPMTSPDVYDDALAWAAEQVSMRLVPFGSLPVDPPLITAPEGYVYAGLRWAARYLAARGAPLGSVDLGEFGSAPLYSRDPEIAAVIAQYGRSPLA
jgi:hypothetical protein